MSYQSQAQLAQDGPFAGRVDGCLVQQSQANLESANAQVRAHARDYLATGAPGSNPASLLNVWLPIMAAEPGLADTADNGDGTIDSSKITDQAILSSVQSQYPKVASLLYDETGAPLP